MDVLLHPLLHSAVMENLLHGCLEVLHHGVPLGEETAQKEETITSAALLCLEGGHLTALFKVSTGLKMSLQEKKHLLQKLKGLGFVQMAKGSCCLCLSTVNLGTFLVH